MKRLILIATVLLAIPATALGSLHIHTTKLHTCNSPLLAGTFQANFQCALAEDDVVAHIHGQRTPDRVSCSRHGGVTYCSNHKLGIKLHWRHVRQVA